MGHGGPVNNLDNDRPERGYREARARLVGPFNTANRPVMARIAKMTSDCAKP